MLLKNVFILKTGVPCDVSGYIYNRDVVEGAAIVYNNRLAAGRSGGGTVRDRMREQQIVLQNSVTIDHMQLDITKVSHKASNLRVVDNMLFADVEVLNSGYGKLVKDIFANGVFDCDSAKNNVARFTLRGIVNCDKPPIADKLVIIAVDVVYN